jgi:Response regulator containing CheY-like receiver, AAA-type ATPase, and DNA-binding domains
MRPVKSAQALIVDDDHDICCLLKRLFEREGISVATAHDGSAALELVDEVDPDVLLLDVKMPDTDGMEVLRRIRRTHPQLAVVMMTAFAGVTEAVEAMKIGAVDFLHKPYRQSQGRAPRAHGGGANRRGTFVRKPGRRASRHGPPFTATGQNDGAECRDDHHRD